MTRNLLDKIPTAKQCLRRQRNRHRQLMLGKAWSNHFLPGTETTGSWPSMKIMECSVETLSRISPSSRCQRTTDLNASVKSRKNLSWNEFQDRTTQHQPTSTLFSHPQNDRPEIIQSSRRTAKQARINQSPQCTPWLNYQRSISQM